MKILHLTGEVEDTGGVLSVIRNIQQASGAWGWQHGLWVNKNFRQLRNPILDLRQSRFARADSPSHLKLLANALPAVFELKALLRRESFDILHAHTRGALLVSLALAVLWKKQVVFTNHNYPRRLGLYQRAAAHQNIHTTFLTRHMADSMGIRLCPPRTSVVHSCCADSVFQEPLSSRSFSVGPDTLRLTGLGSLVRWKGWHLVIQAMALLARDDRSRVRFSLYGPTFDTAESKAYEAELKGMVRAAGLDEQFIFCGPSLNVSEVLRGTDFLLHPTPKEPFGVVLVEAMALGIPVLASNEGGPAEIVQQGENGLLFKSGDVSDIAEKLSQVLHGYFKPRPPEWIRESVRRFSATEIARAYGVVYEDVLQGRVNARPRTPSQSR